MIETIERAALASETIVTDGISLAMNRYNRWPNPIYDVFL
jgi:hypothetical protein